MIKLDKRFVEAIESATTPDDLFQSLQNAIELEHSTIPPYLTAVLSLKQGKNDEIATLIRGIMGQEMLHMCIACNILIAIGGTPRINTRGFAPDYPGPLPMHIGGVGFTVGIEAFSKSLVKNTFMVIEEPENPIPVKDPKLMTAAQQDYATIGAFYAALQKKIREMGDGIFVPNLKDQVLRGKWFPADQLFPITDVRSANKAIEIIIVQGEGTSSLPYQGASDPAHYYKFGEIAAGHRMIQTPEGYAYRGAPIPFDDNEVYNLKPNCKIADFPPGSQASTRLTQFNTTYNTLLNTLHLCFNGQPDLLDTAIGVMYSLRIESVALMQTPIAPGSSHMVGPSYEYRKV
ncbi:ferritin-like domain-containing protein [Solimicrobium silvestre]|uniref:Ferritin-like n=1 Tax=Solimicrobium silvestre TaxID=2099400 RepID=A0A2S9H0B3_9BURK|nr:ferritin-like protein [Solimicrobium silvestre]PRC93424.1 Ferritin-like [Solimicrobium silvestre]